jgi:hypothetical protein
LVCASCGAVCHESDAGIAGIVASGPLLKAVFAVKLLCTAYASTVDPEVFVG